MALIERDLDPKFPNDFLQDKDIFCSHVTILNFTIFDVEVILEQSSNAPPRHCFPIYARG